LGSVAELHPCECERARESTGEGHALSGPDCPFGSAVALLRLLESISAEQLENQPYRIIGVVVMVDGVGLVGTLSGFLAGAFPASRRRRTENTLLFPSLTR
jgi:hypothetical protein